MHLKYLKEELQNREHVSKIRRLEKLILDKEELLVKKDRTDSQNPLRTNKQIILEVETAYILESLKQKVVKVPSSSDFILPLKLLEYTFKDFSFIYGNLEPEFDSTFDIKTAISEVIANLSFLTTSVHMFLACDSFCVTSTRFTAQRFIHFVLHKILSNSLASSEVMIRVKESRPQNDEEIKVTQEITVSFDFPVIAEFDIPDKSLELINKRQQMPLVFES